jgi:hypothetical protein
MKFPVVERSIRTGLESRRGTDSIAQTVQDLIHVAALASQKPGAAVYFPETFVTRW